MLFQYRKFTLLHAYEYGTCLKKKTYITTCSEEFLICWMLESTIRLIGACAMGDQLSMLTY